MPGSKPDAGAPDIYQLRIHGVSGTHPRDMLYTDPLLDQALPGWTGKWKPPAVNQRLRAFHWGGMTSGSIGTALWVLLFPFALANVSGWTASPDVRGRTRFVVASRVAGIFLSGLFALQMATALIDALWGALDEGGGVRSSWKVAGLTFVSLLGYGWVVTLAARSHFDEEPTEVRYDLASEDEPAEAPPKSFKRWRRAFTRRVKRLISWGESGRRMVDPARPDPTGEAMLPSSPVMWEAHPTADRLLRIHLGFGCAVFGLLMVSATAPGLVAGMTNNGWLSLVAWLMIVALVILASGAAVDAPRIALYAPVAGLVIAALGAVILLVNGLPQSDHYPALHDITFWIVDGLVLLSVLQAIFGKTLRGGALLVVAALFGGAFGAGIAALVSNGLKREHALAGAEWLSAGAFLWLLVVACILSLVFAARASGDGGLMVGVRAVARRAMGAIAFAYVLVVAAMIAVTFRRCRSGLARCIEGNFERFTSQDDLILAWVVGVLTLIIVVSIAIGVGRARKPWLALGIFVVGGGAILALSKGTIHIRLLGFDIDLDSFAAVAKAVGLLLPTSLVLGRIWAGFRSSDARRGVGVIWDLAGMWPRWYHPMAPTPYGPKVVTDLSRHLTRLGPTGEALGTEPVRAKAAGHKEESSPMILAAHSQGSVLAAAALSTLDRGQVRSIGLITYGSPLASHYHRLFPAHINMTWLDQVKARLVVKDDPATGEMLPAWRNLWRPTDPIGGPLALANAGLSRFDRKVENPKEGHSRYELELAFQTAEADVAPPSEPPP